MNIVDKSMHSLRPWKKEGVLSKGKIDSKQSGSIGAERECCKAWGD